MTAQNDIFKMYRCEAMVNAFLECTDEEHLFSKDRHLHAKPAGSAAQDPERTKLSKDSVTRAMSVMRAGQSQLEGTPDRTLAIDICHSVRITDTWYRDQVMYYLDNLFRQDQGAGKRFKSDRRSRIEQDKYQNMVERQDAFEQKERMLQRRFNGGHCSYFHRWFQHPIFRLSQAK
eukprot:4966413-Amphidinium_carterae.1